MTASRSARAIVVLGLSAVLLGACTGGGAPGSSSGRPGPDPTSGRPASDSPGAGRFCGAMFPQASFVGPAIESTQGYVIADEANAPLALTASQLRRASAAFARSGDPSTARTVASLAAVFSRAAKDPHELVVVPMQSDATQAELAAVRGVLASERVVSSYRFETAADAVRRIVRLMRDAPPAHRFTRNEGAVDTFRVIVSGPAGASILLRSVHGIHGTIDGFAFAPIFDRAEFLPTVLSLEHDLCRNGFVSGPTLT